MPWGLAADPVETYQSSLGLFNYFSRSLLTLVCGDRSVLLPPPAGGQHEVLLGCEGKVSLIPTFELGLVWEEVTCAEVGERNLVLDTR